MITLKRTNSEDPHFIELVMQLDADLAARNGDKNAFYAQFNKIDLIKHAVVAYLDNIHVGCGAIKEFSSQAMEVKRMFVPQSMRGQGIADSVLGELERWAAELGYEQCVLETGEMNPEAVKLYTRSGYGVIPNYGQYADVATSICFMKWLG